MLIIVSSIMHIMTFILLGMGSIYESNLMCFSSLITLTLGLWANMLALTPTDEVIDYDNDPYLSDKT